MNNSPENSRKIRVIFNGKKYDKSFELQLPRSVTSIKRLKDFINSNLKSSINLERFRIFNYKGIEIDEADLDYFTEGQYLYISSDGSNFSSMNYFNEYEIISSIKSGGYGEVFLAKHVITGKFVALKQNNVTSLSNEEVYNIGREALHLQSFRHRNIIKYINSFSHEQNFYMVMDYAAGGELGYYLEKKIWFTEKEAKKFFAQIIDAVLYMHDHGVIHRDLKPNNLLFLDKEKTHIAIIDFGISGYSFGRLQDKVKAGTMKFVPPEVSEIPFYFS